jgi:hypothetical protein
MADIGRWLHALFTPQSAYGQTRSTQPQVIAPAIRTGNTYQGQALPAGVSSLLASSQDSRGKRVVRDKPPAPGPRLKNLDKRASVLVSNLFAGYPLAKADFPDLGPAPSDEWMDALLDRTGFFDPYQGGTLNDRRGRVVDAWSDYIGLPRSPR